MPHFITLTLITRTAFGDHTGHSAITFNTSRIDSFADNQVRCGGETFVVSETAAEIWAKIQSNT